jgi:hypothetical protein
MKNKGPSFITPADQKITEGTRKTAVKSNVLLLMKSASKAL